MATPDATLQELIVRALTGMDRRARERLDAATAGDPEMRRFCDELDELVNTLAGCRDWRSQAPSAELTAKVRTAVSRQIQHAPPQFKTALLSDDLGRSRSVWGVALWIVAAAVLLGALAYFAGLGSRPSSSDLRLSGQRVLDARLSEPSALDRWLSSGQGTWLVDGEGLKAGGGEAPAALHFKEGQEAAQALAFDADLNLPGFQEASGVTIFLAQGDGAPTLSEGLRPVQGLALEFTRESLVLTGPGQALLHSKPVSHAEPRFCRVRIEHLGTRARVLVNGNLFFEGILPRALEARIYPGVRVSGPDKSGVRFNAFRIER